MSSGKTLEIYTAARVPGMSHMTHLKTGTDNPRPGKGFIFLSIQWKEASNEKIISSLWRRIGLTLLLIHFKIQTEKMRVSGWVPKCVNK